MWEICQYGKARGYTTLDLGGVDFDDPQKYGITDFKQSFGGKITDTFICRYETPFFRLIRQMVRLSGREIH